MPIHKVYFCGKVEEMSVNAAMRNNIAVGNVTLKPVLNSKFSTRIIFRCTKREFAEGIKNGKFFFNTPDAWIKEEEQGNKGQGDKLEGTFFSVDKDNNSDFVNLLKSNNEIEHFEYETFCYFRKKNIRDLYCLCFYGLNDFDFEREVDNKGRATYTNKITQDYFSDFSNGVCGEEYEKLEKFEQPVVVMIRNPRRLFRKIKDFFIDKGVKEEEIIISPVEYLDKKTVALSAIPYPGELLIKDNAFKNQSEIRVIINSHTPALKEYMEMHQNIIDVGDISQFVDIFDSYFDDLLMEVKDNHFIFTRPSPVFKPLNEFEFTELLGLYAQAKQNEVPESCYKETSKEEYLEVLQDIIENKYHVKLLCEDEKVTVVGVDAELWKKLDEAQEPERTIKNFKEKMDTLINGKNFDEAHQMLKKCETDETLCRYTSFYNGLLCVKNNMFEVAIKFFSECINGNVDKIKSLDYRGYCYHQLNQYYLSIADLNRLQDLIGYHPGIYVRRGVDYLLLNRCSEAIEEFNKALDIMANYGDAYYNRGVANFKLGNKEKAKADMEKSIELEPSNQFRREEYEKVFGILDK